MSGTDEVPLDSVASPALRRAYDAVREPVEAELMRRKRALLRGAANERRRERDAQAALAAWIDALSPAGAFARFAETVVGTGAPALSRWERAVDDHQARLEAATFDRPYGTELFAARERYLRITYLPNAFDPGGRVPRYDELPAFSAPAPDLAADVRAALPSLGALLAHALVCLLLAAHAVLRMEV
ncbi:hypothetical protein [Gemmatirosa kalamazoonensis]|nr:hypothetical protein [Gemmatirosa kalamazoonensis]